MQKIGELGEEIVKQWLINQGYIIIDDRWHCRWGEIDIIAYKKDINSLIFVEVKTRSYKNLDENGLLSISQSKQQKILLTAQTFLSKNPSFTQENCRFDVAIVLYKKQYRNQETTINFIKNNVNYQGYEFSLVNYIENAFS